MSEKLSEILVSVLDDYLIDQAETMDREVVIARVAALEAKLSKMDEALTIAGADIHSSLCASDHAEDPHCLAHKDIIGALAGGEEA